MPISKILATTCALFAFGTSQTVFAQAQEAGKQDSELSANLSVGATVVGTATSESGAAEIDKALADAGIQGAGMALNVTVDVDRNTSSPVVRSSVTS